MSAFSIFKERLELRLKKYPELQHLWSGQVAVVTLKSEPAGAKVYLQPGPRQCSALVKVDDGGYTRAEWVEVESVFRAMTEDQ